MPEGDCLRRCAWPGLLTPFSIFNNGGLDLLRIAVRVCVLKGRGVVGGGGEVCVCVEEIPALIRKSTSIYIRFNLT